jgi:nucleoside-diphosphate-sugar epimerase
VPQVERTADLRGDVAHTLADVARAKAELGYEPRTGVEDGIRRFVQWYRDLR